MLIGPLQLSTPPSVLQHDLPYLSFQVAAKAIFFYRKEFRRKGRLFHASTFSPAILILLLVDITNEGI
jgi:hypothetical protein